MKLLISTIMLIHSQFAMASYYDSRGGQRYYCSEVESEESRQPVCEQKTLRSHDKLLGSGCRGFEPWACYQDLLTTCTDRNGKITQTQQTTLMGCYSSFSDCP